jgi:hypothetical protein
LCGGALMTVSKKDNKKKVSKKKEAEIILAKK